MVLSNRLSAVIEKHFWWLLFLLLASTFWFIAIQHGRSLGSLPAPNGFHGAQADALLHGRLHLFQAPQELLELDNPYDPVANKFFRDAGGHDLALFGDKIYSVHNFGPAIFLHIPYRLLGLGNLNPRLSVLVSSVAASLLLCRLIDRMLGNRRELSPTYWLVYLYLIGLGSPLLWLVSVGRAYEESISLGQAFLLGGLCLLVPQKSSLDSFTHRPNSWMTFLGLLSMSFAGLCRPSLFVCIPIVCVWLLSQMYGIHLLGRLWRICFMVSGATVVLVVYLYLNWRRFGEISNFGTTYQLAGMNMREYRVGDLAYLLPNLGDYLFALPRLVKDWPFFRLAASTFRDNPNEHSHEPLAGVFAVYPHISLLLVSQMHCAKLRLKKPKDFSAQFGALLIFLGVFAMLVTAYPFNSATMRYGGDFVPLLVAGGATFYLGHAQRGSRSRKAQLIPILVSAILMTSFSLTNCLGTGSC